MKELRTALKNTEIIEKNPKYASKREII